MGGGLVVVVWSEGYRVEGEGEGEGETMCWKRVMLLNFSCAAFRQQHYQ